MFMTGTLFWLVLHLVLMGINITGFFIVVRILIFWKPFSWLRPFDNAGKSLVDGFTSKVDRVWNYMMKKHLTLKGRLIIGLIGLEAAKVILCGIGRLL